MELRTSPKLKNQGECDLVLVIQDDLGFTNPDPASSYTRPNMPNYPFLYLGHRLIKLTKV